MQVCLQLYNLKGEKRTSHLSSRQRIFFLLKLKESRKHFIYDNQNLQTHHDKLEHGIWSQWDQQGRTDSGGSSAHIIISGGRTEKALSPEVLVAAHKLRVGPLSTVSTRLSQPELACDYGRETCGFLCQSLNFTSKWQPHM